MPNPRCETNKFSLAFFFFLRYRFCRCGHNAKGNGSPQCPISRKKSLHKKFFLFAGLNNISILQRESKACAQTYICVCLLFDGDTFSFLHFFLRPFCEYERIIFLGVSCSTLTYFFAFGDVLMRVEKMEGKKSL